MSFKKIFGFLFIFVACSYFIGLKATVHAENWIDSTNIKFSLQKTDTLLPTNTQNNNIDCHDQTIPISEPKTLLGLISIGSSDKVNICGNDTKSGFYGGGYLGYGGNTAGNFRVGINSAGLLTSDNLENFVIYNNPSSYWGQTLYFAKNLDIKYSKTSTFTIPDKYKYDYWIDSLGSTKRILGLSGENLLMMVNTASFSSNGQWLLFDTNGYGQVRFNTLDSTIMPFGAVNYYDWGVSPNIKTAISPDGRYAIFASGNSTKVYDLGDCLSPSPGSYLQRCKVRDIESVRQAQQPYGQQITNVRFVSSNEFTFYASKTVAGRLVYNKYRATIGDIPEYGYQYLGLGDSFASGEGAYEYRSPTDTDTNKCHSSLKSYSYLIGSATALGQYNSVACSGAVIDDIYQSNSETKSYIGQYSDGKTQSQRDILEMSKLLSSFIPGKITQSTFVNDLDPAKVTLSIGGNDIGFGDIITNCVVGAFDNQTCLNDYSERFLVLSQINAQIPRLKEVYENLKTGDRKVYIIGYPKIIKPGGNCSLNVQLNNAEVDFADKLTETLNDAIETASKQAGVFYVDVENVFVGHRLCETDYADTYVNGLTLGNDKGIPSADLLADQLHFKGVKFIGSESFHPKASGHEAYKAAILNATNNLTADMPVPNINATFNLPTEGSPYWGVLKPDGKTLFYPKYSDFIYGRVNVSESVRINLSRPIFMPGSLVNVMIHSTPINIGSYNADLFGNFDQFIKIPSNIEPGFHTIHLQGKDIFGHDIDAYDYVLISKYLDDFDGDGILDEDEGCVFMPGFGSDTDKDGLDDACDPVNNPSPVPQPTPTDETSSSGSSQNNLPPSPPIDNSSNNSSSSSSSTTAAPTPTDPPEVIDNASGSTDPLPEISSGNNTPIDPKPTNNNETVAGNEQVINNPSNKTDNSNVVQPTSSQNGSIVTARRLSVNENQYQSPEPESVNVLGENQVKATINNVSDKPTQNSGLNYIATQPIKLYKKASFNYLVIGFLALIFLIIFGLRRRTGQRQI